MPNLPALRLVVEAAVADAEDMAAPEPLEDNKAAAAAMLTRPGRRLKDQGSLLVVNTIIGIGRGVLTVGVGLLLVRYTLQLLGTDDYGIWASILAALAISGTVISGLTFSLLRNLSFQIGKQDVQTVGQAFSTAVLLFLGLATLVTAAAPLGPLLIGQLGVEVDRQGPAVRSFQLACLATALGMLSAPFKVALTAFQEVFWLNTLLIGSRVAELAMVLILFQVPGDRLLNYSIGYLVFTGSTMALTTAVTLWLYPVLWPRLGAVQGAAAREVGRFTLWNLVAGFGETVRDSWALLLTSTTFGVIYGGAARSAMQAALYQKQVSMILTGVTAPVVNAQEGRGDSGNSLKLAAVTCRLSMLGAALLAVPLLIGAEAALALWLTEVPPGAAVFLRLATVMTFIRMGDGGLRLLFGARDRPGSYAAASMLPLVAAFGAAWLLVDGKWPYWSPQAMMLGGTLATSMLAVPLAARLTLGVSFRQWLVGVMLRVVAAVAPAAGLAVVVASRMEPGPAQLLAATATTWATLLLTSWFVGLTGPERRQITRVLGSALGKLRRRLAPRPAKAATGGDRS